MSSSLHDASRPEATPRRRDGPPSRRRDRLERTRLQIADATARCIALYGVKRLNVADVARECGVTRATIYNHFGSREQLVAEGLRRAGSQFLDRLEAGVEVKQPPLEVLVECFVFLFRELPRDPVLSRVVHEPFQGVPRLDADAAAASLFATSRRALRLYERSLPGVPDDELDRLGELCVRIALSSRVLGDADPLLGDPERTRSSLRAWLGPIVAGHERRASRGGRATAFGGAPGSAHRSQSPFGGR